MYNIAYKKIEHYLYNYNLIGVQIDDLKSNIKEYDFYQSYTRYIKNKSSSLEDLVINNDNLNSRINKLLNWQNLILEILNYYENNNKLKYNYIICKYFNKIEDDEICQKLELSYEDEKDIQADILQYIFFCAVQKNMLKGGQIYAKEDTCENPESRTTKAIKIR